MKTKFLVLGMAFALLTLNSCKKDEVETTAVITAEEATITTQIDAEVDDVTNIVEKNLTSDEGMVPRYNPNGEQAAPTCATITRTPADLSTIKVNDQITKTIDFGTSGCTNENGNVLKGKIILSFNFNPTAVKKIVNCTFVDFYHNGTKFSGTKKYTREINSKQKLQSTADIDMTATFQNGKMYTRKGQRVIEMVTLFTYNAWGSWVTTFPNATSQTSSVDATTPLFVDFTCNKYPITKGVLKVTRENNSASIDYGTGNCDNTATFTINGISVPILVGK